MRKKYQAGSVVKDKRGYWVGKYRDVAGKDKSVLLGKWKGKDKVGKKDAEEKLSEIVKPINLACNQRAQLSPNISVRDFIEDAYFPVYERKWKGSTADSNKDRVRREIIGSFGDRELRSLVSDELQDFLDSRKHFSFSTVDHLRWDLRQILATGISKKVLDRNEAELIFTPRECPRPKRRVMDEEQIKLASSALQLRERVIVNLAILAGMRAGEIFALKGHDINDIAAEIKQRLYRGKLDTPKTGERIAGLSEGLHQDIVAWMKQCPAGENDWLFPSEKLTTPLSKDNAMRRYIKPQMESVGLGWVDFHVMRRTNSSLSKEKEVDPKVSADQQGHGLGVHMAVYAQSSIEQKREAVQRLESALVH